MCDCFTCANKDDLKSCKAYLIGQFESYKDVLDQLEELGIISTSIADNKTIGGLMSRVRCNTDDCGCLLSSPKFKDIHFKGKASKF